MAWMMAIQTSVSSFTESKRGYPLSYQGPRTLAGGVLAVEVLLAVPAEGAVGLDLRSGTTGELLVELANVGHADSVGVGTEGLKCSRVSRRSQCVASVANFLVSDTFRAASCPTPILRPFPTHRFTRAYRLGRSYRFGELESSYLGRGNLVSSISKDLVKARTNARAEPRSPWGG